MSFSELAKIRQSCRKYNPDKPVSNELIDELLEAAILSPSACNGQPYKITVAKGEFAKKVAHATTGMGMNKFAENAPVMLIISEDDYVKTAAIGAKLKDNDYRSIDIGILSAFITLKATEMGLGTCILGWFDDKKIRSICNIDAKVRLVITLGYPSDDDTLRQKKRKDANSIVKICE